jgi:hypothetical protein
VRVSTDVRNRQLRAIAPLFDSAKLHIVGDMRREGDPSAAFGTLATFQLDDPGLSSIRDDGVAFATNVQPERSARPGMPTGWKLEAVNGQVVAEGELAELGLSMRRIEAGDVITLETFTWIQPE